MKLFFSSNSVFRVVNDYAFTMTAYSGGYQQSRIAGDLLLSPITI